ncbi:unnamed protein product (mitochondrion) [Plasmodiophora brassicae]|uniref:Sugar phosphate transporter domain-containing protein n=1 Tax=Plasmodiophora brassicae TaxID=37360 RepID=A0A3P3XYR5_PLABS|nr:unnamed protein product [Plasmodiophora brassicae]
MKNRPVLSGRSSSALGSTATQAAPGSPASPRAPAVDRVRSSAALAHAMRPVWKMAVAVLFYITVGVLITFYNKMVLSYRGFKFEITMIFVHSISNCLLSAAYCYAFLRKSSLVTSSRFWPGRITWSIYYRQLLPLGALLGFDITLTNLAFRLSSVALTEVVKSGVPLLVLAAGVAMHQETLSRRKVAVILLLSLGIVLTTFGEFRLRFTAIVAAAGAAVCGAAKLVLLQMLMKGRDHIHPTLSLMYMTSSAVISLLIPLFWFEWSELVHSSWVSSDVILSTLSMLLIGSGLAFLLNMSELIVVQWSSALSLCVAGVFKLIIVIIVSSALFDFRPSIVNVFGCVLSLVGIAGYNWVRYHDARRAAHYEKLNLELTEFDMDDVTPAGSDIGDDDNVFK